MGGGEFLSTAERVVNTSEYFFSRTSICLVIDSCALVRVSTCALRLSICDGPGDGLELLGELECW